MARGITRRGFLLAALVVVALGALLAAEVMLLESWRNGVKTEARARPKPAEPQQAELWQPPDELVTMGAIDDMTQRPLFMRTRRPPKPKREPEPEPEPPPKAEKLALRLTSTIITKGNAAAIFAQESSEEVVVMGRGDKYKGWKLVEISPDMVVFKTKRQEQELRIRPEGPPESATGKAKPEASAGQDARSRAAFALAMARRPIRRTRAH